MDSPYFDGCYFDETYFDASECVAPVTSGGRGGRIARRRPVTLSVDELIRNDDEEALLILEGL